MEQIKKSTIGIEIETCINVPDKDDWFEMIDSYLKHLQDCGLVTKLNESENYTKWTLVEDSSIKCGNFTEEDNITLGTEYNENIDYAAAEIVSRIYSYKDLPKLEKDIQKCIITKNFVFGFNSSQGIHYNIGNKLLTEMEEDERTEAISRILTLWWKLESTIISYLPKYRQEEVYKGKYCKSLHRVFDDLDDMLDQCPNFYIKNSDDDYVNDDYNPTYTSVNLKNVYEDTTEEIYFEFRIGSIHINPKIFNTWIKMLSAIIVIGIDKNLYSELDKKLTDNMKENEKAFRSILNKYFKGMGDEILSVIEKLNKNSPGFG